MLGIDALEGFLPRRCKERHVLIREMVACLDAASGETPRERTSSPEVSSELKVAAD